VKESRFLSRLLCAKNTAPAMIITDAAAETPISFLENNFLIIALPFPNCKFCFQLMHSLMQYTISKFFLVSGKLFAGVIAIKNKI
jgi:hypothetical protein